MQPEEIKFQERVTGASNHIRNLVSTKKARLSQEILHMSNTCNPLETMGHKVSQRKKHSRCRTGTCQSNSELRPNRMLRVQKMTSKGGFFLSSYGALINSEMKRNPFADAVRKAPGVHLSVKERKIGSSQFASSNEESSLFPLSDPEEERTIAKFVTSSESPFSDPDQFSNLQLDQQMVVDSLAPPSFPMGLSFGPPLTFCISGLTPVIYSQILQNSTP